MLVMTWLSSVFEHMQIAKILVDLFQFNHGAFPFP